MTDIDHKMKDEEEKDRENEDKDNQENPYLIFFLHLERYSLISSFIHGHITYDMAEDMSKRHGVSPSLIYKLACRSYKVYIP